ncbi:MAG: phage tail sheath family protein [Anaerolineales bacterium]|nr:phage tail sheath family protein [Anaerolineales bacterium]
MIYNAPGIYVKEVPSGARPIQAVGTSTAAFVGVAPDPKAPRDRAIPINNWTEFVRTFAGNDNPDSTHLSQAVYGFFLNGGSRCYVVAVEKDKPIVGAAKKRAGLDLLAQVDEVAIVAAPGYTDADSYDALLSHCEEMKDRVAVLDSPAMVEDVADLTQVAAPTAEGAAAGKGRRPRQSKGGYGAAYYPWLVVRDAFAPSRQISTPPSGYVAGIWARSDATRGVHKAPANEIVRGALNVTHILTRDERAVLNPAGINVIHFLPQQGVTVWGARTVDDGSSEWRYLNVRRLFNMIEESIATSTRWIVFEPNDQTLWKSIRRDINAFLTRVWRDGALMGRTPDEAFFVKCDEETNPRENIDAGIVTTLIGIAPVKPAEFIVFRISQYEGGTETETEGGR